MSSLLKFLNVLNLLKWISIPGAVVLFLLKFFAIAAAVLIALFLVVIIIGFLGPSEPENDREVDDRIRRRLVGLCYGDSEKARRLAYAASRSGRSEQWAWEKAVEDLLRDRR